jgi:hypothetical protein
LAEGIHDHRAALGDHLKTQTAPGGPVLRAGPAGINGGEHLVIERQHFQSTGFHLYLVSVEDAVAFCVYVFDFGTSEPAHDIHKMDGVIDDRTAACQL